MNLHQIPVGHTFRFLHGDPTNFYRILYRDITGTLYRSITHPKDTFWIKSTDPREIVLDDSRASPLIHEAHKISKRLQQIDKELDALGYELQVDFDPHTFSFRCPRKPPSERTP